MWRSSSPGASDGWNVLLCGEFRCLIFRNRDDIITLSAGVLFQEIPLTASLSEIFYNKDLSYSYEDYLEHIRLTAEFCEKYHNCQIIYNDNPGIRNINIVIIDKKEVIVSKNKSPSIHFVIYHPRMIEAFRNLNFPIKEDPKEDMN